MLTGYPLSCTLGRSVLGIGSGVARFLMIAEYATYRYLRCVVNVMLLLSQLSVSNDIVNHAYKPSYLLFSRFRRIFLILSEKYLSFKKCKIGSLHTKHYTASV